MRAASARCSVSGALAALHRRRRRRQILALVKLVVGLLLLFTGPVLASVILYWVAALSGYWVAWPKCLAVMTLILVPLLLWTEWRTQGRFLSYALAEGGTRLEDLNPLGRLPGPHVAIGGLAMVAFWRNPAGLLAGLTEILLTGPRLIFEVYRDWRLRRRLGRVNSRRAAELLAQLDIADEGLPLAALLRPGEHPGDLVPPLRWLAEDEWLGVCADGQRVYLYSPGREELYRAARGGRGTSPAAP